MDAAFRKKLRAALALDRPYEVRRPLSGGRSAGVLALIGASRDRLREPRLLLTRRTDTVTSHKGQIAFPGGASEADEVAMGVEGAVRAALRETHEEVGIPPGAVDVVGQLPEMTTITDFRVVPTVGLLRDSIEEFPFRLNVEEIAEAFWVSFSALSEPGVYRTEFVRVGQVDYPVHVYQVDGHRVWGATGAMVKNLLDRLREASTFGLKRPFKACRNKS